MKYWFCKMFGITIDDDEEIQILLLTKSNITPIYNTKTYVASDVSLQCYIERGSLSLYMLGEKFSFLVIFQLLVFNLNQR